MNPGFTTLVPALRVYSGHSWGVGSEDSWGGNGGHGGDCGGGGFW